MLKTIFTKTLFEKRWMTLWWLLANVALVVFIVIFFPTLKDSLGKALESVPESMRSLIGTAADYQTLPGYLNLQVFQQMIFLPVILGVILFTGLTGGEERDGVLQTLLTNPVSRSQVYIQKFLAASVILAVVTGGFWLGSCAGAVLINEHLDLWRLLEATFMSWLVGLSISALGFALSSATGKRALAGSIAGAYAFMMYVITSLVDSVKPLEVIERLSPFHYFNHPSPLTGSLNLGHMVVLLTASVVLAAAGYIVFVRRDIYQR